MVLVIFFFLMRKKWGLLLCFQMEWYVLSISGDILDCGIWLFYSYYGYIIKYLAMACHHFILCCFFVVEWKCENKEKVWMNECHVFFFCHSFNNCNVVRLISFEFCFLVFFSLCFCYYYEGFYFYLEKKKLYLALEGKTSF